ncbi:MAG TPA: hypothetical protein VJN48_12425 [Terriglobales bacterium]|nr:hypothetical protein [Terriglobales bacterium]
MKSRILLRCALLVFFLALAVLMAGFQGKSSIAVAWPASGSVVQLSGSVNGWKAIGGLAGFAAALVLFLWGLVSLFRRGGRKGREEPLSEPHTGAGAKGQAASQ